MPPRLSLPNDFDAPLVPRIPDEQTRIYIMVDDIPDTLRKIEAAGGRVLTPRTDIAPGSGAFAVFADPAGTEFGLYEEPRR
jgi:predicted enzyme related to lactoylglutathione lyase